MRSQETKKVSLCMKILSAKCAHQSVLFCTFTLNPYLRHLSKKILQLLPKKKAPSASGSSANLEDGSSEILNVDPAVPHDNSKTESDEKGLILGEKPDACLLSVDLLSAELTSGKSQPMFLSKKWREAICGCEKCSGFYAKKGISFLLDKEDSIAEYEKMAKQKRDEKMQQQEGAELNFLNNLGACGEDGNTFGHC